MAGSASYRNPELQHKAEVLKRHHKMLKAAGKRSPYSLKDILHFTRIDYLVILGMQIFSVTIRATIFPEYPLWYHMVGFVVNTIIIIAIWEFVRYVNRRFDEKMPYENGIARRMILQTLICVVFICGVFSFAILWGIPRFAPIYYNKVTVFTAYVVVILATVVINVTFFGSHFFAAWKKQVIATERLQKERAQVQYDNLKNQLNPHFLFNALTSLNSLIFENQQLASDFLQHMSKVYRYVLKNKDKELVSLDTEVKFIYNYIFLLKTRFDHDIQIDIHVRKEDAEKGIVPVTLQILLENAIKHNIINAEHPLKIDIYTADEYLCIKNNLQKKSIVETSNNTGLANMMSLYSFLSERPMLIEETAADFTVKVPFVNR